MHGVVRKILDASFELISNKPLGYIKAGDIIKKSDVSKGSFYRYFKDKYDCVSYAFVDKYFQCFYDKQLTFRQAFEEHAILIFNNISILKNISVDDSFLLAFSAIHDEYRKVLRRHILNDLNIRDENTNRAISYLSRTLAVTLYLYANDKIVHDDAIYLVKHFEEIVPNCLKQYIL